MKLHPAEYALALHASGDLAPWQSIRLRTHLSHCEACRNIVAAYRADKVWIEKADQIPEGVNWDRLAAEMTANIRVGLAVNRMRRPSRRKPLLGALARWQWKPVAAVAGLMVLLSGAWWLNVPAAQNESFGRALRAIAHRSVTIAEDPLGRQQGPMVGK